jgi:hypothetical protein
MLIYQATIYMANQEKGIKKIIKIQKVKPFYRINKKNQLIRTSTPPPKGRLIFDNQTGDFFRV